MEEAVGGTLLSQASFDSNDGRRRRRRLQAPARLRWPGGAAGSVCSQHQTTDSCSDSPPTNNKESSRPQRVKKKESPTKKLRAGSRSSSGSFSPQDANAASSLWVDKYSPERVSDLCVAPKKVKEIRCWIEEALLLRTERQRQQQQLCRQPRSKLLILVGSPGIGKSTTVRVIANEMKLTIHDWTESSSSSFSWQVRGAQQGLLSVDQKSPINSFEEFLHQSGVGYNSLVMSDPHQQASTSRSSNKLKRKHSSVDSTTTTTSAGAGSIILLEELPNLHGSDAELRFREILTDHLRGSVVPTVLIFSDVVEGKSRPKDLERLVDRDFLYNSAAVHIMHVNATTQGRMKKVLAGIAKRERIPLTSEFVEDIRVRSGGDVRFAITTMQYELSGRRTTTTGDESASCGEDLPERDKKLTTFHALGKLLYAKRKKDERVYNPKDCGRWNSTRPPLDYDPERVVEHSDMSLGASLQFLGYHSVNFFTDVGELSDAFDLWSDAAVMLDRPTAGSNGWEYESSALLSEGYAACLAGRAVARANKHPAGTKFRQFSAPRIFEVIRNRSDNAAQLRELFRRLSVGSGHVHVGASLGAITSHFVTDCLPFVRTIVPAVNSSLGRMHSCHRPSHESENQPLQQDEMELVMKEQEEILRDDDIVDYDESDEEEGGSDSSPRSALKVPCEEKPRVIANMN